MSTFTKMSRGGGVVLHSTFSFDAISQILRKHLSCNFTHMRSTVIPNNWYIKLFYRLNSFRVIMNSDVKVAYVIAKCSQ